MHKKTLPESILGIPSIEHLFLVISARKGKIRKLAVIGNGRKGRDCKIVGRWGNEKFNAQTVDSSS